MAKKTETTVAKATTKELKITGDQKQDLATFISSKNVDFGIKLLEHYVPRNRALIDFMHKHGEKEIPQLIRNLKIILS